MKRIISKFIDKKNIWFIVFLVCVSFISIGYSALNATLSISGNATARAKADIRVSNLKLKSSSNMGNEFYNSRYTKETTSMYVELPNSNSTVTYTVTIHNYSSKKYLLDEIIVLEDSNESISYIYPDSIFIGTINPGEDLIFDITFNAGTSSDKIKTLILKYKFIEDKYPHKNCTYTGDLVAGAEYTNGQYTYRYMQEFDATDEMNWVSMLSDGWGVKLTNYNSTDPVTTELCSTINGKPITSMQHMFIGSQASSIDTSSFNTTRVTNMRSMFAGTIASKIDVSIFGTSRVTNMYNMFGDEREDCYNGGISATEIIGLENFDTSKVTNMSCMFNSAFALTELDLSSFDTSNVTDMSGMFVLNQGLTLIDVSSFDTLKVTDMSNMFGGIPGLEEIKGLENFDTSKVTDMNGMFWYTNLEILDLSSFDTSKVTDMSNMFAECQVTTVYATSKFVTDKVTDSDGMFYATYNIVGGAGTVYDNNFEDKTYAKLDGGVSDPGYFTEKPASSKLYALTVNPNGGTWRSSTSNTTISKSVLKTETIENPTPPAGYKVTFNSNGGSSDTSSLSSTKSFKSWTLSGKGTLRNGVYTFGAGDGTLKANYNNGSITLPSASRTNYEFSGWYTSSSGGTKVGNSGDTYTPDAAITLYAQWLSNTYDVSIDANDCGTSEYNTMSVTKGLDYGDVYDGDGLPSMATKTGYTFNGWYTASSGGNLITNDTEVSERYTTLYAQCSPITYKLAYTMNGGIKGTNAPTTAKYNSVITIDNPTKTVKFYFRENSTEATLSSTSKSVSQTFNGWTASNLNTSTAKYGTSSSDVSTSWSSTSTKVTAMYFQNLQSANGETVTLTANWALKIATLPTITKEHYTCGWATSSSATAYQYKSGGTYIIPASGSNNVYLYGVCTENPAPTLTLTMTDTNGTRGVCSSGTCTFSDSFILPITLYAEAESKNVVESIKLRWNEPDQTSYTSITSGYESQTITKTDGLYTATRTLNSSGKRVLEMTATDDAGKSTVVTIKANVVGIKTMYVTGVETGNVLRCRESDNTSATKVTGFSCGTAVTVYSEQTSNGWYYVVNPGCYSHSQYLVSSNPSCSTTTPSTCSCRYKQVSKPYTYSGAALPCAATTAVVCSGTQSEFTDCLITDAGSGSTLTYKQWYYGCD